MHARRQTSGKLQFVTAEPSALTDIVVSMIVIIVSGAVRDRRW